MDYLIVDEAQFFTAAQIEQLAVLADDAQVDVYAFGIATDFRGRLFPGSARLFELADEVAPLQVEVLCWCGRIGRFNGRVVDGRIAREGATVVVADTEYRRAGRRRRPLPGAVPDPPPVRRPSDRTPGRCAGPKRPTLVNRPVHGMLMPNRYPPPEFGSRFRVTDTRSCVSTTQAPIRTAIPVSERSLIR